MGDPGNDTEYDGDLSTEGASKRSGEVGRELLGVELRVPGRRASKDSCFDLRVTLSVYSDLHSAEVKLSSSVSASLSDDS